MQAKNPNHTPQRYINSSRLHQSLIWPPQPTPITFTYLNNSANRKEEGVFKNVHLIDSKRKPFVKQKELINPQQNCEETLKQVEIQMQIREQIQCLNQELQGLLQENRSIMKKKQIIQQIIEKSKQQMVQITYCLERNVIRYQIDLQTIKQKLRGFTQSNYNHINNQQ